jgi:hypothetical protein
MVSTCLRALFQLVISIMIFDHFNRSMRTIGSANISSKTALFANITLKRRNQWCGLQTFCFA